jgi:hypothetical protein
MEGPKGATRANCSRIVNGARRDRLQRKKIKRKNPLQALMFSGVEARARKPLATPFSDNWLRLYPEQTRNCISSYVSGAPEELLHAWQERSTHCPASTIIFLGRDF